MALTVTKVDFLKSENAREHNTTDFSVPHLIVRRGQAFKLKLSFNRPVKEQDKVTLQFTTGSRPMESNGTLIHTDMNTASLTKQWSSTCCQSNGNEYSVAVNTAADAIIGKYMLSVITGKGIVHVPADSPIYLLFNPWSEDDTVYMPNVDERAEYILSDTGYIYVGSASKISARPWNFGQNVLGVQSGWNNNGSHRESSRVGTRGNVASPLFLHRERSSLSTTLSEYEVDVLDCCMYLLDRSGLKPAARRDPVILSRKFSALVNANDDQGVLTGNWSGSYSAGTSPTSWTGSCAILQKHYRTKKPVLFGQCWVFSGVLTTVMRCIGIPARCVTNFASAHDTEENLKIDIYMNENGEKLEDWTSDSIWNFHVWNDVWMKRPDLPNGYDGWQAIDATPQEPSQGVFQCGPCSLTAIKNGDVYLPYDGKFVFAEVNADRVHWLVKDVQGEEELCKVKEEKNCIGKCISTKTANMNLKQDITSQYKYREGSQDERKAFQTACSYLKSDTCLVFAAPPPPPPAGIKLKIIGDNELLPGNPLSLNISVENESNDAKTAKVIVGCQLQTYTGKVIANLASITQTVEVSGKEAATIPLNVAADVYMKSVILVEDELIIRVNVISETKDTNETDSESMVIAFIYPAIKVEMLETAKINEDFSCTFTFKNTLCIPLENCELHVEGLGIFTLEKFEHGVLAKRELHSSGKKVVEERCSHTVLLGLNSDLMDIPPGRIFRSKIICEPKRTGERKIVAELVSKQIKGISAEKIITITE